MMLKAKAGIPEKFNLSKNLFFILAPIFGLGLDASKYSGKKFNFSF